MSSSHSLPLQPVSAATRFCTDATTRADAFTSDIERDPVRVIAMLGSLGLAMTAGIDRNDTIPIAQALDLSTK